MNSMFTVTGQVLKTFIQPAVVDRETGALGEPSIKVQLMGEMPVQGGGESRLDLITLTIQDRKTYDALTGKTVRIPLGFFAPQKGNIVYFVPKGSIPEVVGEKVAVATPKASFPS
jgi:hypothetical protein